MDKINWAGINMEWNNLGLNLINWMLTRVEFTCVANDGEGNNMD